jgi:hypothetical protein
MLQLLKTVQCDKLFMKPMPIVQIHSRSTTSIIMSIMQCLNTLLETPQDNICLDRVICTILHSSISAGSTLQGTTVDYIATDTKLNGMEVGTTEPCAPRYIIDCLCSKIKSQNSTEATLGGEFGSNVTTTSTTCSNSGASSRMDHPNLDRNELGGTIPGNRCFKIKCQISTEAILDEVVGIVTTDCTTRSDSDESSCTGRLNFMDCNDWMSLGWADSTQYPLLLSYS